MPNHRKVNLKFLFYSSELVWILFIKKDICFTELLAQILLFYEQIAARKKRCSPQEEGRYYFDILNSKMNMYF